MRWTVLALSALLVSACKVETKTVDTPNAKTSTTTATLATVDTAEMKQKTETALQNAAEKTETAAHRVVEATGTALEKAGKELQKKAKPPKQ